MKNKDINRLMYWAYRLDSADCSSALILAVERLIEDQLVFIDENGEPCWEASGDPILETER